MGFQYALQAALGYLLTETPWMLVACLPFADTLRVKRRSQFIIIGAISLVRCISTFLLIMCVPGWSSYTSIVYICYYALLLTAFLGVFRAPPAKLLYIFLFVHTISTAVNFAALSLNMPFYPGQPIGIARNISVLLTDIALVAAAIPFAVRFIKGRVAAAFDELNRREMWLLCVSPGLFFILLQVYSGVVNAQGFVGNLTGVVMVLLIALTGVATYYVNLRMVMDSAKRSRAEADMRAMKRQLSVQAQSYERLTENIEQTKAARHDLRHHLSVIASFNEKGDRDGLAAYLEEYRGNLPNDNETPLCANYAVDAVVRYYLARARGPGVRLDVKIDLPKEAGIPDSDLCIVFGNIFENAANSVCAQEGAGRYITARCGVDNGKLIVTVDNSMGGAPPPALPGGGLGIPSIRAVAEKYNGTARFECVENEYRVSVKLNLNAGAEQNEGELI